MKLKFTHSQQDFTQCKIDFTQYKLDFTPMSNRFHMFYILPRVISDDIPNFCNAQDLYWEGKQTLENCVAEKRRYDAFLQVYIVCCADITCPAN